MTKEIKSVTYIVGALQTRCQSQVMIAVMGYWSMEDSELELEIDKSG